MAWIFGGSAALAKVRDQPSEPGNELRLEPASFDTAANGSVVVRVQQSVHDLDGRPSQGQTHGLRDKWVGHVFRFEAGKVARFDIQDAS